MATVGTQYRNLIDDLKRSELQADRATAEIIEMQNETNPIMDDMVVRECNDGTTHLTTVRTGIPRGTWTKLYQGVQPTKSQTAQVRDATGRLEARCEVDTRLLELENNPASVRLQEAAAHIEGMNQDMAETLFYGSTDTTPERFTGLSARFSDPTVPSGSQIVNGGGASTDNTSIWIVGWGDKTCTGLYPKNTTAGVGRKDLGQDTTVDANGGQYEVMREKFTWHLGLSVRDWRYIVRIANIAQSEIDAGTVDLYDLFKTAWYKYRGRMTARPGFNATNQINEASVMPAIYANTSVIELLDQQATVTASDSYNAGLRIGRHEIDGKEIMSYRGVPIREVESLLNTEELVTFA